MNYESFLIANSSTGLDKSRQPWLIPNDAFDEIYDAYVDKGVINKRQGYNYYAIGGQSNAPYCESRMVTRITSQPTTSVKDVVVDGNATAGPYVFRLKSIPVRRGTVTITDVTGAQSVVDDGAGAFTGTGTGTINYTTGDCSVTFTGAVGMNNLITATYDFHAGGVVVRSAATGAINGANQTFTFSASTPVIPGTFRMISTNPAQGVVDNGSGAFTGDGTGTINYATGAVSVTLTAAPVVAAGSEVYVIYLYSNGNPVMGHINFTTSTDTKTYIPASTAYFNQYNGSFNRLDFLGRTMTITGISNFNPGTVTSAAHGLVTGQKVLIHGVQGMFQVNSREFTITNTGVNTFTIDEDTTNYGVFTALSTGNATLTYQGANTNFWSWTNYDGLRGTTTYPRVIATNYADEIQYYDPTLTPSVGNYINYSGFAMNDDAGAGVTSLKALHAIEYKDRLLLFRTIESGVVKPRRIRISGLGSAPDNFTLTAEGAGKIDIPDQSWIISVDFNHDDLVIFTEYSTWILKYTGNDSSPFYLARIDESRGSSAPFGTSTYLNLTSTVSRRALIGCDGYKITRMDDKLPDFSFSDISQQNINLCYAGYVDDDRNHYLIYPSSGDSVSQRILVRNYDENSYSIYRFPLSCMGNTQLAFNITWNDLASYNNWSELAGNFANWYSFSYFIDTPAAVGGGHNGEIWKLNVNEAGDNQVRIRNITQIDDQTLEITTDWNNYSLQTNDQNMGTDYILISSVSGMVEVNDKQYPIKSVTNNYTFRIQVPDTEAYSTYTSGGVATRIIPMQVSYKKFNPYISQDKKVRCGWLYMYVDSSQTPLRRNVTITNAAQTNPCLITTQSEHNFETGDYIYISNVGGMTQINTLWSTITVVTPTSFTLDNIDATGYTAYTSGGIAQIIERVIGEIQIITNDRLDPTQTHYPYEGTVSNLTFQDGQKKWYKIYVNQTGKFVQFIFRNQQANAPIAIHAIMPGFMPVGRIQ